MMVLPTALVFLVAFLVATVAVVIAWFALGQRARAPIQFLTEHGAAAGILKQETLSTISPWARLLERFDFVEAMRARIAEADLKWTVGRVTLMMLLSGTLSLALLLSFDWAPGWAAAIGGALAAMTPYWYVLSRRTRRLLRFEEQFPDSLDSLARALRAGHSLAAALELLAQESVPPLSVEMRKTADERSLGLPWQQALENLARRVPLLEVNMFVAAVSLQNRTGGKLTEVLAKLAETIRESAALKGEVRAISAHGRLTGMVLTLVPIFIAGVLAFVNPGYLDILLDHPLGKHLIAAAILCLALARFVISRIVDIRP